MELFLMQHGEALPKDRDPERGLSPEGKAHVETAGRALAKLGVRLDRIVSSPKKRAQMTAQALARAFHMGDEALEVLEALEPLSPPEETVEALQKMGGAGPTLLAGHLPSLAEVAAYLMDCQSRLAFRLAGVGCLQVAEWKRGGGTLLWYLTPEHLLKIAG